MHCASADPYWGNTNTHIRRRVVTPTPAPTPAPTTRRRRRRWGWNNVEASEETDQVQELEDILNEE
uniref:Uncharacterized protein n=1 Tax=Ciona intestinalis TaxID=7719 RepID=F7AEG6_CIOIN